MKKNNVLVAIMNSQEDFDIAKTQNWYRIPVRSAPSVVKDNEIEYLSFYHTKRFDDEAYKVIWYSKVKRISIVKRKELFPEILDDPKADVHYYKIEFEPLLLLPEPILSTKPRRIIFIPTTDEKLFSAKVINTLFNTSAIEERLWEKFLSKQVPAERQFYVTLNNKIFVLDFAIFCKEKNINIECDGDEFHTSIIKARSDKFRNNVLTSAGWSVLRFNSYEINKQLSDTYRVIYQTIRNSGGLV